VDRRRSYALAASDRRARQKFGRLRANGNARMKKDIREFVRKLFFQKPPYKLKPIDLEIAMRTELPKGTRKGRVIEFVQATRPFLCDDCGKQIVVNLVMDTGDLVHVWEVVIIFDFSSTPSTHSTSTRTVTDCASICSACKLLHQSNLTY
jgi:hypothetical protein